MRLKEQKEASEFNFFIIITIMFGTLPECPDDRCDNNLQSP